MAFIALPDAGRQGERAWVFAVGGEAPEEWTAVLAGLGLEAVHVDPPPSAAQDLEEDDTAVIFDEETRPPGSVGSHWSPSLPEDGLVLLWHAEGFDAAIGLLSGLDPAHLRSRVVICAPDAPTGDLGAQVRDRGGLTWWRAPWAPWVLSLALAALRRAPAAGMLAPAQALERLQRDARVRPRRFLATVADAARQALGADGAEVLVLDAPAEDGGVETVRLSWVQGRVHNVPLTVIQPGMPPMGLAERAVGWQQVVVLPDIRHTRVATGGDWAAAVAVPILTSAEGPAPRSVLQVYWRRPFLPTPAELQVLRTLGTAAAVNEARSVERELLSRAHVESLRALTQVPWASSERAESGATTEADLVSTFARRVLQARITLPGLQTFYANLSTASRGAGRWLRVDLSSSSRVTAAEEKRLAEVVAQAVGRRRPEPVRWSEGVFAIGRQLQSPDRTQSLGDFVATFSDRTAADEGGTALRRLGADLQAGLRLLRRSDDSSAMKELARILSDATDADPTLARMAGLIQRQLNADGVKVYVLARHQNTGRLVQLLRTGRTNEARRETLVSGDHGLADWVVRSDDWLCLEHPPPLPGALLRPASGRSGGHGEQLVRPRPVSDYWEGALPDAERVQLLVPLHHRDQVAGVLGVWRTTEHPFEAVLDVESMVGFAPHVASACARATAMQQSRSQAMAIQHLARALQPETSLHELSARMLDAARKLSGTSVAVLLRHDTHTPGALVVAGTSGIRASAKPHVHELSRGRLSWGASPDGWQDACAEWLAEVDPDRSTTLHQLVVLPRDESRHPIGAVVLLVRPGEPWAVPILAEAATRRATETFLQFGGLLLANHVRVHVAAVVEQLARLPSGVDPISLAADRLRLMLPEAVVVTTRGSSARQQISKVAPATSALVGTLVDANSFARTSAPSSLRLGDVPSAAPHELRMADFTLFKRLQATCLPEGVRSWMGVPVVHGVHLRGVLHVVTGANGPPLLPEHELLAESVARWAAEEAAKVERRAMLELLNRITSELAGVPPNALAEQLPVRLQEWSHQALHRNCQIGVVARSGAQHVLLCAGTNGLSEQDLADLRALSSKWAGKDHLWDRRSRLPGLRKTALSGRFSGATAPLKLNNNTILEGHLFVLHAAPFSDADRDALADAAREAAVLLHGEVVRHEWKLQAGLFRHALLGPVQGLQSAARLLDELTQQDNPPVDLLQRSRDTIASESETLHLWRETQKLITEVQEGNPLDLRPKVQELRPLVQTCLDRYEASFRLRNIDLRLDYRSDGALRFAFDGPALDLILSNLLDNAGKYTFYNRVVVVLVEVVARAVQLIVENVGTGISDELADSIYEPGTRARGRDPIRAIAGEGLGLFLSRTLARALGGDLTHTCEALGVVVGDKQPHRVRFTVSLPHGWGRR